MKNKLVSIFGIVVPLLVVTWNLFSQTAPTPPPIPTQPSGQVRLTWDYPTNFLGQPFTISVPPGSTNLQVVSSPTVFYIYGSADLTNWVALSSTTNSTSATVNILPVGARFLAVTASNFWGLSSFSPLLWLPPLPAPGTNLQAQRLP